MCPPLKLLVMMKTGFSRVGDNSMLGLRLSSSGLKLAIFSPEMDFRLNIEYNESFNTHYN